MENVLDKNAIIYWGLILAFVAGAINASGFLAVGYYTSDMSGMASSIADYIILHNIEAALLALHS
ncbi:MAG: DUF1275 family protein [Alphaproteobacteria bacterium]